MSRRIQIPMKPGTTSARSFTPSRFGILQRKCACGGKCDECKKKETTVQRTSHAIDGPTAAQPTVHNGLRSAGQPQDTGTRASLEPSFGHDFSRLRIHADSPFAGSAISVRPHAYAPQFAQQPAPGEDNKPVYSAHGLMMARQSGTCQNGGGSSDCDLATGKFYVFSNNNTCCTKDCTQQHEQTHVADYDASGCCKALSDAYNAKGADKAALVNKYNDWIKVAVPVGECHAYSHDVTCADGLAKAKDCDGKGKGTDCCKDIAAYKSFYGDLAKSTCATAAAKMPPCPAF